MPLSLFQNRDTDKEIWEGLESHSSNATCFPGQALEVATKVSKETKMDAPSGTAPERMGCSASTKGGGPQTDIN